MSQSETAEERRQRLLALGYNFDPDTAAPLRPNLVADRGGAPRFDATTGAPLSPISVADFPEPELLDDTFSLEELSLDPFTPAPPQEETKKEDEEEETKEEDEEEETKEEGEQQETKEETIEEEEETKEEEKCEEKCEYNREWENMLKE